MELGSSGKSAGHTAIYGRSVIFLTFFKLSDRARTCVPVSCDCPSRFTTIICASEERSLRPMNRTAVLCQHSLTHRILPIK